MRGDGGGGGVDVFSEDLASEGIDPETVPKQMVSEAGAPTGEEGSATSESATRDTDGAERSTETSPDDPDDFEDSLNGDTRSDDTSTLGAIDAPGSTSIAAPTVSTDPSVATGETTRSVASTSRTASPATTTPSRFLPTTSTPASDSSSVSAAGSNTDRVASNEAPTSSNGPASTTTSSSPAAPINVGGPAATTPPPAPAPTGEWCQIEVRESDGVIRWNDEGRTAVFRLNGAWFHTPDPDAQVVLIPDTVDTSDEYVLRVWGDGTDDIACTFSNPSPTNATVVAAPASTTAAPTTTTTTTTTTTIPEAVAFTALPAPIRVPSGPPQFGFAADLWGDDRTNYWNNLEAVPGAGRLIAHEFKSFDKAINTDLYRWHMQSGRDLLLTWNGTDAEDILNGSHDDWIRLHAHELRSLPGTVMLRFWHEPDVSHKRAWIDHDPQQFIDSWMHVRRIFVEEQALNIEWVWCPTAWNWAEQGARYYPGDANVDWICADGYSGWDKDAPLPPVQDAYIDFQAWANQRPHKPILVAEFGAESRGPGDRADWIAGIPGWVEASPNIRAVVYFDVDRRPNGEIYDWRIRTEPEAWEAMMNVISSAPFGR